MSQHAYRSRVTMKPLCAALLAALGSGATLQTAQADIYTFSFGPGRNGTNFTDLQHPRANDALFTMLDPVGKSLQNTSQPYYYDPTWGYGKRSQISGTLTFDTSDLSGSATLAPINLFGSDPNPPPTLKDLTFVSAGPDPATGHALVIANLSLDFNISSNVAISLVWDIDGLLGAIGSGLGVGDTLTGGSLPASDDPTGGAPPIGPSPVATTTWNTTPLCGNGCTGLPSGGLPLIADGIGGSPMLSGPFPGFNINLDIHTLKVESISSVPLPPALLLFGSGALGLLTLARRRNKN